MASEKDRESDLQRALAEWLARLRRSQSWRQEAERLAVWGQAVQADLIGEVSTGGRPSEQELALLLWGRNPPGMGHPVRQPQSRGIGRLARIAAEQPTEQPAEQPAEQSIKQPAEQSIKQSAEKGTEGLNKLLAEQTAEEMRLTLPGKKSPERAELLTEETQPDKAKSKKEQKSKKEPKSKQKSKQKSGRRQEAEPRQGPEIKTGLAAGQEQARNRKELARGESCLPQLWPGEGWSLPREAETEMAAYLENPVPAAGDWQLVEPVAQNWQAGEFIPAVHVEQGESMPNLAEQPDNLPETTNLDSLADLVAEKLREDIEAVLGSSSLV